MARVAHDKTLSDKLLATAAWWLLPTTEDTRWRRRCVESISFSSKDDVAVGVTGQISLPVDPRASVGRGPRSLFLVPYFWLGKQQARTSPYEIRDEHGLPLATYTRAENRKITQHAFGQFAINYLAIPAGMPRLLAGKSRSKGYASPNAEDEIPFEMLLARLIGGGRTQAAFSLHLILRRLDREHAVRPEGESPVSGMDSASQRLHKDLDRFKRLLRDVAAGEVLWVPIEGMPASHCRLELTYTTTAKKLSSFRSRRRRQIITLAEESHVNGTSGRRAVSQVILDEDRQGTHTIVRRLWNSAAHWVGFAPYEAILGASAMHRWSSYHLRVDAPPGLEIRGTQLAMRLAWGGTERGHVRAEISPGHAHLMVSHAQSSDQAESDTPVHVRIRMRAGDRHITFFAAATTALVAVMLWVFARMPSAILSLHTSAISEVLVIVPALLLTFAARPGEHALASRVLGGVRLLVLVSGACCVAAAVLLTKATFNSKTAALEPNTLVWWRWDARVATIVAGLLIVSAALSVHSLDQVRRWIDKSFEDDRLAEKEQRRPANLRDRRSADTGDEGQEHASENVGSRRYRRVGLWLWRLQAGVSATLLAGLPVGSPWCVVIGVLATVLFVGPSAVLAARGESMRTNAPGIAGLLGSTSLIMLLWVLPAMFASPYPGVVESATPYAFVAILLLAPCWLPVRRPPSSKRSADTTPREGHVGSATGRRTGEQQPALTEVPGAAFVVASAEGDLGATPALEAKVRELADAIVCPPSDVWALPNAWFVPWAPTEKTVVVDVAGPEAR